MSEILLQTIIEKLDALEIAFLKQRKLDNDPAVIKEIAEHFRKMRSGFEDSNMYSNLINKLTTELSKRLNDHSMFQQPVPTKIEHRHHLHKGIWISAILCMTVLLVTWGWLTSNESKNSFEANDIKYRALKVTGNKVLLDLLYQTDSLYHQDESAFREYVVVREKQLAKQSEISGLAGEKKKIKDSISRNRRSKLPQKGQYDK